MHVYQRLDVDVVPPALIKNETPPQLFCWEFEEFLKADIL